ncbi:hypothetical protein [Priestia aryabhattai]
MTTVKVKGKPTGIKEITLKNKDMIAMNFEETDSSNLPKELKNNKELLVLMNLQQWQGLVQSIVMTGDSLNKANDIIIEGEVKKIKLPDGSPKGVATIVCSRTEYLKEEKREKVKKETAKRKNENNIESHSNSNPSSGATSATNSTTNPTTNNDSVKKGINTEIEELHKKYEGVCQSCGQRCDKKVIYIKTLKNEKIIVCPDCNNGRERPKFKARKSVVDFTAGSLGLNSTEARKLLEDFPLQYALVSIGPQVRVYWTWNKKIGIGTLFARNTGEIFRIIFRKGVEVKKSPSSNDGNAKRKWVNKRAGKGNVFVKNIKYRIIDRTELPLEEIQVPDVFLEHTPRREKIDEKLKYYHQYQQLDKSVVVIKNGNDSELLDGYTRYIASKELNLKKAKVIIVEKADS